MKSLGIERILWSNRSTPEQIQRLNDMGVLTSRYDIYQDLMDPANFPKLGFQHPDWTSEGWPNDIVLRRGRLVDPGLGRAGQGREVVLLRRAMRLRWPLIMRVAGFLRNSPRIPIAVASSTRQPLRNGVNATTRITP